MRAEFLVPGYPAPKGSRTTGVRKDGSRYTRESSKRAGPWMQTVAAIARMQKGHNGGPLDPPYEVELHFGMPEPAKPKYPWPTKDGDVEKLARCVVDGLVIGGLLLDDRHVTRCDARKHFVPKGTEGVVVTII